MKQRGILLVLLLVFFSPLNGADNPELLSQWLADHGTQMLIDPLIGTVQIELGYDSLVIAHGQDWGILNGTVKTRVPGLTWTKSGPYFDEKTLQSLTGILFPQPSDDPNADWRISTIVIDPGHGGKDPGSVGKSPKAGGKSLYEKEVTLEVGLMLRDLLARTFPTLRIIMTRDDDTFISLDDRTKKANAHARSKDQSVLFVSIHANASLSTKAKGYEVWYLPASTRRQIVKPGDYEVDDSVLSVLNDLKQEEISIDGYLLASSIQKYIGKSIGDLSPARGLKEEEWYVVRNAFMPSVLVELGFVTNPDEYKLLSERAYLHKLAEGIYNGIVSFMGDYRTP